MTTKRRVVVASVVAALVATVVWVVLRQEQGGSTTSQRNLTNALAQLGEFETGGFVRVWDALDDFIAADLNRGRSRQELTKSLNEFRTGEWVKFAVHPLGATRLLVVASRHSPSPTADFSGGRASVFEQHGGRWQKLGRVESRLAREFRLEWRGDRRFVLSETALGTQRQVTSLIIVDVADGKMIVAPRRELINATIASARGGLTVRFDKAFEAFSSPARGPYRKFETRIDLVGAKVRTSEKSLTPWFDALESRCAAHKTDRLTKPLCAGGEITDEPRRGANGRVRVKLTLPNGPPCDVDATWHAGKVVILVAMDAEGIWRITDIRPTDAKCTIPAAWRVSKATNTP